MTGLEQHLADFLAVRRGLGFKLTHEQRMLNRFVALMDDADEPTITVDLAQRWATMPTGVGHAYLAQRMRAARGFARYLHGIDSATEVPPLQLLPAHKHRPTPHIYTNAEIARADGGGTDAATGAARRNDGDAHRRLGVHRSARRRSVRAGPPGHRPQARPLPPSRRAARLPRRALIMPSNRSWIRPPSLSPTADSA